MDQTEHQTLLQAPWIAPMDGPLLPDAAVVWAAGRILAVGPAPKLRIEYPQADVEELPDAILLPGLVNPHTHLELSFRQRSGNAASFVDWLIELVPRQQLNNEKIRELVAQAIPVGLGQCLRFGVTTVGDISRHCYFTRPLLARSPLRVVSYGEVHGMGQRRMVLEERIAAALDQSCASERLRIGLSPHAPYSTEGNGYRRCLELARRRNLPLATHLAETADEGMFLAEHGGELRRLWDVLGAWDELVPKFQGGPIRFAHELGLLQYPTLLAHVNYCDDEELPLLAEGAASIVYCPRTHAYFGHGPHRWREMLAMGINVAVGTDSCASSPDLNIMDDLRLLHRLAPEIPGLDLLRLVTINAAVAIGENARVGTLAPGKCADVVAFPTLGRDLLSEVLEQPILPCGLWIDGRRIY